MTALTVSAPTPAVGVLGRITRVVKLHFVNPKPTIVLPWFILAVIFVANLAIWWMIRSVATDPAAAADAVDGFQYSGSMGFVFFYMAIVAILAMNQTFGFALGIGVTRRDYYLGTALTFVLLAVIYTAGISLLGAIERATGGWGLGGRMFTPVYFGDTWAVQTFCIFAALLLAMFIGSISGAIYVRFKSFGITVFWCIVGLAIIGAAALLTLTGNWGIVGDYFARAGFVGGYATTLVITVASAVGGFFVLRRATPRS